VKMKMFQKHTMIFTNELAFLKCNAIFHYNLYNQQNNLQFKKKKNHSVS